MTSFMIFQNAEMCIIFLQRAVAKLSCKSNSMFYINLTLDRYAYGLFFFLSVLHSFCKVLMRKSYVPIKHYLYLWWPVPLIILSWWGNISFLTWFLCHLCYSTCSLLTRFFFEGSAESGYLKNIPPPAAVSALNCLRQLMQDALQKSTSRKTWEQPHGTVVQGPLSWKQLHHLATKGQF